MPKQQRKLLGRYIVADPAICHGKPTFIGTRVMVWQVLEMVSEGMDWDDIVRDWRNSVPKEAIAEAIDLAKKAFVDHATEYLDCRDFHFLAIFINRNLAFLALPERHRYVRGLMYWVGFKQTGVPYARAVRVQGVTHYPFSKMLKLAFDAISSFSFFPLRLATGIGFLASAAALLVVLWALYLKVFTDRTIHGWTSQILVMLFLKD